MSRLIDVDKAENDIIENVTTKAVSRVVAILQGQPTVKAIPIEWIMWVWRRNQPDDTQEDAWMRLGVLKMLRDWRKEHEEDI